MYALLIRSIHRMASRWETEAISYVNTLLHTINPTTFLEATAGVNWGHQWASPLNQAALDANNRAKVAPGLPQFFPGANPLDLLPNATFNGGIRPSSRFDLAASAQFHRDKGEDRPGSHSATGARRRSVSRRSSPRGRWAPTARDCARF